MLVAASTKLHLPDECIKKFLSFREGTVKTQTLPPQYETVVESNSTGLNPLNKAKEVTKEKEVSNDTSTSDAITTTSDVITTTSDAITSTPSIDDDSDKKPPSIKPGPLTVVHRAPPEDGGYDDPTELLNQFPIDTAGPSRKKPAPIATSVEAPKQIRQTAQEQAYVNLTDDIIPIEQYSDELSSSDEPTYVNITASNQLPAEPTYINTNDDAIDMADTSKKPSNQLIYVNANDSTSREEPAPTNVHVYSTEQPVTYEVPIDAKQRSPLLHQESNILINSDRYEPKSLKSTDKLYEHIPASTITMTMPKQDSPKEEGSLFVFTGGCNAFTFHCREESSFTHNATYTPCVIAYQVPELT